MNPLALCALLGLGCAAPAPAHLRPAVLGMVAGQARAQVQADWDTYNGRADAPERMYEVMKDSLAAWRVGPTGEDTLLVLVILEVRPVPAKHAYVLGIEPMYQPLHPTIHTHNGYCDMTPWGPDRATCSLTRPEAHQCRPSLTDERTQAYEGHPYDVVMCGREQFVFFFPKEHA